MWSVGVIVENLILGYNTSEDRQQVSFLCGKLS